jgi:hypothetical protein
MSNRQIRRAAKRQHPEAQLRCVKENDDLVLYCDVEGKPIAKRYSGQNWISLEPGWRVLRAARLPS